jgi:glycoside/pentoside/hexuronide:cation symporter, GPH family
MKLAYGSGSIADGAKNAAFNSFLLYYYTAVLGLPGTLSGLAIFLALCVDAITDPLVGSISDNFASRWGRRHPFMYFAAIPMGLCFYALFSPPAGLGSHGLFLWLTSFAIGVRLFLTFYMVPSGALAPEMTTHYDERTSLVSFRWLLGWLGSLSVSGAGWFWFFRDSGAGIDGRLEAANYPALGLYCCLLVTTAILVSSAGTHSLIPSLRRPQRVGRLFSPTRFAGEVRNALANRSYRMLLAGSLFSASALGVQEVFGTYMYTYFWEFRSEWLGTLALLGVIPVFAGVALARPVSGRLDKRRAAIALASFAVLFGPVAVAARLLGVMPANGEPLLFWLVAVHGGLIVLAAIQIGILFSSMIMDSIDESELATGLRQEGIFVSAIAFTNKAVSGLGNFVGGLLLDAIGFPRGAAQAAVGAVPEQQVILLGLLQGPGMMFFYLCSLIFLVRYQISRERYREIVHALAERARTDAMPPGNPSG